MADFYESDRAVSEYLFFHYGNPSDLLPWDFGPDNGLNYPARCADLLDLSTPSSVGRALDLGCAVGRSTFELARHCGEVLGIDYSLRFIEEASALCAAGERAYRYVVEGTIVREAVAKVGDGIDRSRVSFRQGDAGDLPDGLGRFDVVLMANLLCRLPRPREALAQIAALIETGGQLLITTPCTWMEEYTPRENWLGGFVREGNEVRTLDSLHEILGRDFELEERRDLPFLIREHERKFQWSVAEGTRWRRR
ncbi:MAG: putative 4-mercaptohistidine N1-methyltransferase [Verrucomicrobiae bacterium]|nr:putative 4-mercaptohistidine N1-methyltransferase [Verrucomicrobiae bacterium]